MSKKLKKEMPLEVHKYLGKQIEATRLEAIHLSCCFGRIYGKSDRIVSLMREVQDALCSVKSELENRLYDQYPDGGMENLDIYYSIKGIGKQLDEQGRLWKYDDSRKVIICTERGKEVHKVDF